MKHLLILPFIVFGCMLGIINTAHAECNVQVKLNYDGNQDYDSDEFLYKTQFQYDLAKQGYKDTNKKTSGNGLGYECDYFNSASCEDNDVIEMPAGHVWEGEVINKKRRYKCFARAMSNDTWKIVQDDVCHTKDFGDIAVGYNVSEGNTWKRLTKVDCSEYELTDVNGIEFEGICRDGPKFVCKAQKCIDGMIADNGVCKKVCKTKWGEIKAGTSLPDWVKKTDCAEYTLSDPNGVEFERVCNTDATFMCKAKACGAGYQEFADANGKCIATKKEAPAGQCQSGQVKYHNTEKCVTIGAACAADDLPFGHRAGVYTAAGKCPARSPDDCLDGFLYVLNAKHSPQGWCANKQHYEDACKKKNKTLEIVDNVKTTLLCVTPAAANNANNGNGTVPGNNNEAVSVSPCDTNTPGYELVDGVCQPIVATGQPAQPTVPSKETLLKDIKTAKSQFDDLINTVDVNKWRNMDGEFNTARLASDSIAAVVLGTTGGVITSTVMKKKQAESGFEDLQCTVGGQVVATWGDEFSVGIR